MGFDKYMDEDILNKFEFYNYGHALEILHDAFEEEWKELQDCFRRLKLTLADIKKAGGNESPIPKKFDEILKSIQKESENSPSVDSESSFIDGEKKMTRLFINIGKRDGVRPANILGAIAGESGISGNLVGSIDMYDNYTFVDVPQNMASEVLDAMNQAKIKGRSVTMERAQKRRR